MAGYNVTIADNYHYMDKDEWVDAGTFWTPNEAMECAKRIVNKCLEDMYEPGLTPASLYMQYQTFGDDPFITGPGGAEFSAWTYAKARCIELVAEREASARQV